MKRIVFCTGQVYYDLAEARKKENIKNVAIVRVEQLAPFPFMQVLDEMKKYDKAQVMWVQEEPKNFGSWYYTMPRFINLLKYAGREGEMPHYAGRGPSASSSTGYFSQHEKELKEFVKNAMTI